MSKFNHFFKCDSCGNSWLNTTPNWECPACGSLCTRLADEHKPRTAQEILEQTNELAGIFYGLRGYKITGEKFYETDRENYHPDERYCWQAACQAQELLTGTDVSDVLNELDSD